MAIFIPGGVTSAVSGTIGGTNYVLGKQGPFCRNAFSGNKGFSPEQLEHRRAMRFATYYWQQMSSEYQLSWRRIASTIPFLNRFGISRFLSGFQLFSKYVMENYDKETEFNIACDIIGYTPKPVVRTASLNDTGHWAILTDTVIYSGLRTIKVFVSRPVRNTHILHFGNWFRLYWDNEPHELITIQSSLNPHPRLANCRKDEWVSLRVHRRAFPVSGQMLYSAPTYYVSQII